ncbi:zinc ribbon domain-containing protein [Kineococcus sp. SYSU DK005]|uniref:zinc ribbon domain-containing protein n=1 Tax=Kineococcus sp. SYSU DK005 TaxID=3383126 RepID=UPI003D7E9AD3
MAQYQYRCPQDGLLEVDRPMGTAPAEMTCPDCAGPAKRSFTGPMVSFASRARVRAIEGTESSRDEPRVVAAPPAPARPRRTAPADPALRRLPRP